MGLLFLISSKSDKAKIIEIFRFSTSRMGKLAIVVLFLVLPFSNGALRDMVETGYVQDPDLVGKLPLEFEADLDDIELERSIDDDFEEDCEEDNIDEERALNEDLELIDPQMRSEIEDYCNTDEGKTDEALCNRISSRAAKGKPKKKTKAKKKPKKEKKKPKKKKPKKTKPKKKPKKDKKKPKKKISHRIREE